MMIGGPLLIALLPGVLLLLVTWLFRKDEVEQGH